MKKSLLKVLGLLLFISLLFSCDDFLNAGGLKNLIDEQIAIHSAESVVVRIQTYDPSQGTITPNGDNAYRLGETITIDYTYNPMVYVFSGWGLVNKTNYNFFQNENGEYIRFFDETVTSVGTLKKVSVKATINSLAENIQIMPIVSDVSDNTAPRITSDFCIAADLDSLERENYLSPKVFENWNDDSDFSKNHVSKIAYKFTAGDTGISSVLLKVKETLLYSDNGETFNIETVSLIENSLQPIGPGTFNAEGIYEFKNFIDGIVKLEFSIEDAVGNESDVFGTYYVVKDTKGPEPSFILQTYKNEELYSLNMTKEQLLNIAESVYVEVKPSEDIWFKYKKADKIYKDNININNSRFEISTDGVNYVNAPLLDNGANEKVISLKGLSRNKDIYIKCIETDILGNKGEKIKKLLQSGKPVSGINQDGVGILPVFFTPYQEKLNNCGLYGLSYTYFGYEEGQDDFISLNAVITRLNNLEDNIKLLDYNPNATYHFYALNYYKGEDTEDIIGLISDEYIISGKDIMDSSRQSHLLPQCSYELISDGINTGTYTIKIEVENYDTLKYDYVLANPKNTDYNYSGYSTTKTIYINNVKRDDIKIKSKTSPISFEIMMVKDGVVYGDLNNTYAVTIEAEKCKTVPDCVGPKLTLDTAASLSTESLAYYAEDNADILSRARVFYSNELIPRTIEEIKQLPYLLPVKKISWFQRGIYFDALDADNYVLYLYEEDSIGNFTVKTVYICLQKLKNFVEFDYSAGKVINSDIYDNRNIYYHKWLDNNVNFATINQLYEIKDGSGYKWNTNSDMKSIYLPDLSKNTPLKFYRITAFRNTYVEINGEQAVLKQGCVPYIYYPTPYKTLVKDIVEYEDLNIITITSDNPVYVATYASKENHKEIDDWISMTYPLYRNEQRDDSDYETRHAMLGKEGGAAHEVSIVTYEMPDVNQISTIPISKDSFTSGDWYTTVVFFADGTKKMTTPRQKK